VLLIEFTIEPFVEGQPGPHVLATIAAVEALGVPVEFGPFGSSCTITDDLAASVAGAIVDTAYANGATHVIMHTERLKDAP
jgi:hypothetical protein